MIYKLGYKWIDQNNVTQINWTTLSGINLQPVLSNEQVAISGIFDCPKRIGETERNWDTEVEPFVDNDDIMIDGREISVSFICKNTENIDAIKTLVMNSNMLQVETLTFDVISKYEIDVNESGNYFILRFRFWQDIVSLPEMTITPSNTGNIKIDNYNLNKEFGIYGSKEGGFYSVGPRLEVNTTDTYKKCQYRNFRELSINCMMVSTSFTDLYSKMCQFQSLLLSEGLRTLYIDDKSYSCYFKSGFKAQMVGNNVLKFNLKLSTND